MELIRITIEDCGQDFTVFYTNASGRVIDAQPFQGWVWRGAIIPVEDPEMFKVGEPLPIHHPPHIIHGFLRYRIEKIEYIDNEPQDT